MINDIVNNKKIKTLYIISTNYTLLFAEKMRDYLKLNNIHCVIYDTIYESLINKAEKNNELYLLFIGTINLINNNILKLPINKYIIYQIEQLNQDQFYYNKLSPTIIDIMFKAYALYDYSIVNLDYYPMFIRSLIKISLPYIPIKNNICIKENNTTIKKNILFIGTLNERRNNILNKLNNYILSNELNYNLLIFEKLFGNKLKEVLEDCSIVLNLHYYDNAILEVFRIEDIIHYNIKIYSENPGNNCENYLIDFYNKNNLVNFFPIIDEKNNYDNIEKLFSLL